MNDVRPIDANALKLALSQSYNAPENVVDEAPTLDYAPVRYGEWKFDVFTAKHGNPYRCSICEEEFDDTHNYCPSCGTKMDGGKTNG